MCPLELSKDVTVQWWSRLTDGEQMFGSERLRSERFWLDLEQLSTDKKPSHGQPNIDLAVSPFESSTIPLKTVSKASLFLFFSLYCMSLGKKRSHHSTLPHCHRHRWRRSGSGYGLVFDRNKDSQANVCELHQSWLKSLLVLSVTDLLTSVEKCSRNRSHNVFYKVCRDIGLHSNSTNWLTISKA